MEQTGEICRVELGLGRGGLELKLDEEENKYIKAKSIEAKLKFNEVKSSCGQICSRCIISTLRISFTLKCCFW